MSLDLEPGEELLVCAPLHPLVRFPNLGLSACVVGVTLLIIARNPLSAGTVALLWAAAAAIVLGASVVPHLRRRDFALAVTDRRIVVCTGRGRKRAFERARLREVTVDQTWWSRLLGHAAVGIVPLEGGSEVFPGISQPDGVREALSRRRSAGRRRRE
jgi:hypothetical protein